MQNSIMKKKCIKVTFDGETKRLKVPATYELLVQMTREKFPQQGLEKMVPLKFYYLDDEQELISITSQSDFLEALDVDDSTHLKLTVANNTQEARIILEKQIGDNMSMASSVRGPDFAASLNNRASNVGMPGLEFNFQEPVEDRQIHTERLPAGFEPMKFMDEVKQTFEKTL